MVGVVDHGVEKGVFLLKVDGNILQLIKKTHCTLAPTGVCFAGGGGSGRRGVHEVCASEQKCV